MSLGTQLPCLHRDLRGPVSGGGPLKRKIWVISMSLEPGWPFLGTEETGLELQWIERDLWV